MPLRRRTGDPFYRSSAGALPRPSVSYGDLQGAVSQLKVIDPDTGEILRTRSRRGPGRGFDRGMGQRPISAAHHYLRLLGSLPSRTPPLAKQPLFIRVPTKVGFCLQRKQRREVLFALRRAGFGGSAPKRRYRRTQNSQWRC